MAWCAAGVIMIAIIDVNGPMAGRMNAPARPQGPRQGFNLHENRLRAERPAASFHPRRGHVRSRRLTYWRARARGAGTTAAANVARNGGSLATKLGGVGVDKLANARSPIAAPAPATKVARIGRARSAG